jgi:hypothetical protein
MAERIVGGPVAADMSPMQAGLDSLGAVDLRRELAAALQLGTVSTVMPYDIAVGKRVCDVMSLQQRCPSEGSWRQPCS